MTEPIVVTTALGKAYGECISLEGLTVSITRGSVVGIVGENGAGKTTFMKLLCGIVPPTSGTLSVGTKRVGMVHQHFSLVPALTVAENVCLGEEPRKAGMLDMASAAERTRRISASLGGTIDPLVRVQDLPLGLRQHVELCKALRGDPGLLLLDEPTAVLVPAEITALLETIARLRERGTTVLMVSHKLKEIAAACDRVIVLRRGRLVLDVAAPLPLDAIARAMVGEDPERPPIPVATLGEVVMQCATVELRAGEIRGIAGVEGNGQSELFAALCGTAPAQRTLFGADMSHASPRSLRAVGVRAVPAERHADALLERSDLFSNLRLGNPMLSAEVAQKLLTELDVRPPRLTQPVASLSGGNQQKLLFARELAGGGRIFIVHEPTRGVDQFARDHLWHLLRSQAASGAAIVVLSSDLDELRALSTSLQVIFRGALSEPLAVSEQSDQALGRRMSGMS